MKIESTASMLIVAAVAGVSSLSSALAQNSSSKMLPYTTVDHPQFVPASQATFLSSDYVLIGIAARGVVKAYPAVDLGQHGVVQDQMTDGPIAVTW
jgi:hypothetical protein